MKLKLSILALLLLSLLVAGGNITVARTWTPGVEKGDSFYYEMYGVYTSNRSNLTFTIPQFEYNNTAWVRINITDISGSIVYQAYTLHFKNGSELTFNFKIDLNPENESNLKFTDKGIPICAANLNIGDPLPTAQLVINETLVRPYQGGSRETNLASWNYSDDWGNCYFDRETGMLVELYRLHRFANNAAAGEIVEKADVIKMVNSNRWETNNQSITVVSLVSFPLISFVLLFFVVLTRRFITKKLCNRFSARGMAN